MRMGTAGIQRNLRFPASMGMNVAGIPQAGYDNCGILAGWILLWWELRGNVGL